MKLFSHDKNSWGTWLCVLHQMCNRKKWIKPFVLKNPIDSKSALIQVGDVTKLLYKPMFTKIYDIMWRH